jgi:hypothetical protein
MTNLLNHVELYYRRGDHELAVMVFETMGCAGADVTKEFGSSSTYTAIYPGPLAGEPLSNVLYLSERRQESPLEKALAARRQTDPELAAAIGAVESTVKTLGGALHFGLRYSTFEELGSVMDRLLTRLPTEPTGRVTVRAPFAHLLSALGTEVMQAFVHTDLIGAGQYPFGQLMELQAQGPI